MLFTSAVLQGLNVIGVLPSLEEHSSAHSTYLAVLVGASPLVMQRTLNRLSRAGIITVKRGPGGGFRITEEQLRTKTVKDVLEALGQRVHCPEGSRASDKLQRDFNDMCSVTLQDFFS